MPWHKNTTETDRVEYYHDQKPTATVGIYKAIDADYEWYGQTRIDGEAVGPVKHREPFEDMKAAIMWLDSFVCSYQPFPPKADS